MLHILGMILKGIGIILLCIFLLLLVILLSLLFVPIRYRVTAQKKAEDMPVGRAKVSWLFSIVTIFAAWEGRLHYGLKLFGIPVYDNLRKKRKVGQRRKRKTKQDDRAKADGFVKKNGKQKTLPQQKPETAPQQRQEIVKTETAPQQRQEIAKTEASPQQGAETAKAEAVSSKKPEHENRLRKLWKKLLELVQKLKAFIKKLRSILENIVKAPEKIRKKIEEAAAKLEDLRTFLGREDFKRSFALCKKQLLYIWRKLRPKKCKACARFGFEDPSVTGQILACAGMIYPLLGKDIVLRPEFEQSVLEGSLLIKGRITVFVFARVLCILYFNKDIKRMIHIWKTKNAS